MLTKNQVDEQMAWLDAYEAMIDALDVVVTTNGQSAAASAASATIRERHLMSIPQHAAVTSAELTLTALLDTLHVLPVEERKPLFAKACPRYRGMLETARVSIWLEPADQKWLSGAGR